MARFPSQEEISQSKNSALWITSMAFVKPFVVTYGCMHDMPSPAPYYYLLLQHSAKSSSMRKRRAEFMPGDTSSPRNTQRNQSHAELEKRVLSQHTAHWKQKRQQVIYEGKAYMDLNIPYKTATPLVTKCMGRFLFLIIFRNFIILLKWDHIKSNTNHSSPWA